MEEQSPYDPGPLADRPSAAEPVAPGASWTDEEWRSIWGAYLRRWESDREAARDYVTAQSRWMVGQLFVANGGALTALTTAEPLRASLPTAGPWFVAGVAASILCGFATWGHAQMVATRLGEIADPALPLDQGRLPKDDPVKDRRANIVHGAAVAAGVLSLSAFIAGAFSVAV